MCREEGAKDKMCKQEGVQEEGDKALRRLEPQEYGEFQAQRASKVIVAKPRDQGEMHVRNLDALLWAHRRVAGCNRRAVSIVLFAGVVRVELFGIRYMYGHSTMEYLRGGPIHSVQIWGNIVAMYYRRR